VAVIESSARSRDSEGRCPDERSEPTVYAGPCMSPFWLWTQALIVVFVLAGMVIAITKLV
jgi:hypothetical protein